MRRDLGQWLDDTAVEPSQPIDPGTLILRARTRRRVRHGAVAAGALAVVALLGVLVVGPQTRGGDTEIILQPPDPAQPVPEPDAEAGAAFTPPTTIEGDRRVLPLRFPGGITAEIVYPEELDLHQRGVTPGAVLSIADDRDPMARSYGRARANRNMEVYRGSLAEVLRGLNGGQEPDIVAEYEGQDGQIVGLYELTVGDYLAWQAGEWSVLVPDTVGEGPPLSEQDRASYAAHLQFGEDADGWLMVVAEPPVHVDRAYLVLGNPEAAIEHARHPAPLPQEDAGPNRVLVHAVACTWTGRSEEPGSVSWCDLDTQLAFDVVGSDDYVHRVSESLEARAAEYPASIIDPAWVTEEEKDAWQADHGEGTWVVGYFYPPDFDFVHYEQFTPALEARWKRIADDDLGLDREGELREALVALTGPPPPQMNHLWPGRRLELTSTRLDGPELVLDFSVLLASGEASTGGAAMGAQFDAVVFHYYPEADTVCVLLEGEPSTWLHDTMTCPSRPTS